MSRSRSRRFFTLQRVPTTPVPTRSFQFGDKFCAVITDHLGDYPTSSLRRLAGKQGTPVLRQTISPVRHKNILKFVQKESVGNAASPPWLI